MDDNPLKRLREVIERGKSLKPPGKRNHTLYLSDQHYHLLEQYCVLRKTKPSVVVDMLIELYVKEIKDELPPDPPKSKRGAG